jgi:MraZ protein
MRNFRANFVNKIDAKGRVSVPASFRAVLGEEKTIYCTPSLSDPAIDVYTQERLDEMTEKFERDHDPMSLDYRHFQMIMNGDVFPVLIDGDGRIILPEDLRAHARITSEASFVGTGPYFQIWEPSSHRAYREDARRALQAKFGITAGRTVRRSEA